MLTFQAPSLQTRNGTGGSLGHGLCAVVLIAGAAILFAPGKAAAEMMAVVGNAEVIPGQTGFLDVSFGCMEFDHHSRPDCAPCLIFVEEG